MTQKLGVNYSKFVTGLVLPWQHHIWDIPLPILLGKIRIKREQTTGLGKFCRLQNSSPPHRQRDYPYLSAAGFLKRKENNWQTFKYIKNISMVEGNMELIYIFLMYHWMKICRCNCYWKQTCRKKKKVRSGVRITGILNVKPELWTLIWKAPHDFPSPQSEHTMLIVKYTQRQIRIVEGQRPSSWTLL